MTLYHADVQIRDTVVIDGDKTLTAKVTGLFFRSDKHYMAECSWIQDGRNEVHLLEVWRLTVVPTDLTNQPAPEQALAYGVYTWYCTSCEARGDIHVNTANVMPDEVGLVQCNYCQEKAVLWNREPKPFKVPPHAST